MQTETSIRKRLLTRVMSAILIIWLLVIVSVYYSSANEIDEVYDASLASYARVLTTLMFHEANEDQELNEKFRQLVDELGMAAVHRSEVLTGLMLRLQSPPSPEDYLSLDITSSIKGHRYESRIAFLVKAADGKVLLRSSPDVPFQDTIDGYKTIHVDRKSWRIFGLTEPTSGITVMVAENVRVRTELQREILANGLWPFLVMLPVIALVILGAISKGLQPLQTVANRVATRSPTSLTPLSRNGVPVEILPLIDELNHLFDRMEQTLANERRFTANAAHELRTPLAALKTHVQVLQLKATDDMQPAIQQVLHGIDRATHLVQQLLTLARAEAKANEGLTFRPLDLIALARSAILNFANPAMEKDINLSFENGIEQALIEGDEALLYIVIQNLLDNAIRYTPAKGSVTVGVTQTEQTFTLYIEDSGPGIDPARQDLMFQRFQRGEEADQHGVGLGLFIVNQIARLHDITLSLSNCSPEGGLRIALTFRKLPT